MTNHSASASSFDLIGVGAPIMDMVAPVPESFLAQVRGEKGGMVIVDADEMAQIVAKLPSPPALTTGGSAANTIFNATRLGLKTAFVGKLGGDDLAQTYRARFAGAGVATDRFKVGTLPNARCLILTTPDAQRTMRTLLGAVMSFSPDEVRTADFAGARHVHIEGYVVFNRALADAIVRAARAAGCTISLDLASFEVVRESGDWLRAQLAAGLEIVFGNEDEVRALYPEAANAGYDALAKKLAAHGCTAVVKLGKDGAWIARRDELHRIEPRRVTDAIDTNGAGDAFAAGFLSTYLRGQPLPVCGRVAAIVGAETVRHLGPIIPDAQWPAVAAQVRAVLGGK